MINSCIKAQQNAQTSRCSLMCVCVCGDEEDWILHIGSRWCIRIVFKPYTLPSVFAERDWMMPLTGDEMLCTSILQTFVSRSRASLSHASFRPSSEKSAKNTNCLRKRTTRVSSLLPFGPGARNSIHLAIGSLPTSVFSIHGLRIEGGRSTPSTYCWPFMTYPPRILSFRYAAKPQAVRHCKQQQQCTMAGCAILISSVGGPTVHGTRFAGAGVQCNRDIDQRPGPSAAAAAEAHYPVCIIRSYFN